MSLSYSFQIRFALVLRQLLQNHRGGISRCRREILVYTSHTVYGAGVLKHRALNVLKWKGLLTLYDVIICLYFYSHINLINDSKKIGVIYLAFSFFFSFHFNRTMSLNVLASSSEKGTGSVYVKILSGIYVEFSLSYFSLQSSLILLLRASRRSTVSWVHGLENCGS